MKVAMWDVGRVKSKILRTFRGKSHVLEKAGEAQAGGRGLEEGACGGKPFLSLSLILCGKKEKEIVKWGWAR